MAVGSWVGALNTKTSSAIIITLALLTIFLVVLLGTPSGVLTDTSRWHQQPGELSTTDVVHSPLVPETSDQHAQNLEAYRQASVPDWLREKAKRVVNPYKGCQELYPDLNYSDPYEERYKLEIKLHNATYWSQPGVRGHFDKYKREPDGYSFRGCTAQILLQRDLARIPWVKTVCEVGFNAGHSALTWLAANPDIKLYSFDIGWHPYTISMGDYLAQRFPGRFYLTLGESTKALPNFIHEHLDIKCDVMSVDGGHFYKYAIKDLNNFCRMSNPLNLVLFDDYPHGDVLVRKQDLGRAWEEVIENGQLAEVFRCAFLKDDRTRPRLTGENGISLGHFYV